MLKQTSFGGTPNMKSDEDEERPARERERVFVVSEMSAMEKTSPPS